MLFSLSSYLILLQKNQTVAYNFKQMTPYCSIQFKWWKFSRTLKTSKDLRIFLGNLFLPHYPAKSKILRRYVFNAFFMTAPWFFCFFLKKKVQILITKWKKGLKEQLYAPSQRCYHGKVSASNLFLFSIHIVWLPGEKKIHFQKTG